MDLNTTGFTTPAPRISIQPVCLHYGQPVPGQKKHFTSTSVDGSVKGK